jgi:quinol monooxygenase YgiN
MLMLAGTFRIPPGKLDAARPALKHLVDETRAEDGCLIYTFASDVHDETILRVFEIWRDEAAWRAHDKAPHLVTWKQEREKLGIGERNLTIYEIKSSRPLA